MSKPTHVAGQLFAMYLSGSVIARYDPRDQADDGSDHQDQAYPPQPGELG